MGQSKIEWTDATWNPIHAENRKTGGIGHFCEHVSDGCKNCYAERFQPRVANPVRYARQDRDKVRLFLDEAVLTQPLRWRSPRMIFVCSMTDLFAEFVPDEWIDRVFAVMALCPQHTFQPLTKRSARMRAYAGDDDTHSRVGTIMAEMWKAPLTADQWPLPNVWLGVSCEDQEWANARIPDLLATPAAVRFISAEPLLGPLDLTQVKHQLAPQSYEIASVLEGDDGFGLNKQRSRLDWVIAGGESGPKARPVHPDWFRSLRDQCAAAGVPFFFKQWGEWEPREQWSGHQGGGRFEPMVAIMHDGSECPHDATPQDVGAHRMARVGKANAGRLLDGRTHDDFPITVRSAA